MNAIGIDFSSYWLDACLVERADGGPVRRVRWARERLRKDRGESEEVAITNVRHALWACLATLTLGDADVYIERGYGASRRADFLLGCIYGALVAAVGSGRMAWHSMPRAEWVRDVTATQGIVTKKGTPGNGNAPKAVANECCREILRGLYPMVVVDVADLGPDALDAFGVAYAGSLR